jgi:hypothetical protein
MAQKPALVHNRPRDLKLVSLEPSGNEDSNIDQNCSISPVNETAMQKVWQESGGL